MKRKLYIAYGSNINIPQMERRCPQAMVIGTSELKGYELVFKGVATIEKKRESVVPIVVWGITPFDEKALDRYEGFPHLYIKENIDIELNGQTVTGMAYVMTDCREYGAPSPSYLQTIADGYDSFGFDTDALLKSAVNSAVRKGGMKNVRR